MSSPVNGDTRRPNPEETQPRTGQIEGVDAHCARRSPTIPVSSCRYRSWRTASSLSHASFCCNCATTSDSEPPSPPMPPTDGETTRVSSLPPNPRGDGGTLGGSRPSMTRSRTFTSRMVDSCLRRSSIAEERVVACWRCWIASDRKVSSSQISPLRVTYWTRKKASRTTATTVVNSSTRTVRRLTLNRRGREVALGKMTIWNS